MFSGANLKQFREITYDDLAFNLADSQSLRTFVQLPASRYPAKLTLRENNKFFSEKA